MARDEVMGLMASVATALAADGPEAWLHHFAAGPGFYMASDGELVFPNRAAANRAVSEFAQTVASMNIEPLGADLTMVATAYREAIDLVSGDELRFSGYLTALVARTDGGWKLRNLHWSSPLPVP